MFDDPTRLSHTPTPTRSFFNYGNALILQHKFFLYAVEHRAADPSEICALDSKGNFDDRDLLGFATIGTDRLIL
jgi:hypothetical protein